MHVSQLFEQPKSDYAVEVFSLDQLNEYLFSAYQELDTATKEYARICEKLAENEPRYEFEESKHYAKSYGLDITKPIADQRQAGKNSPGNLQEHKAYVVHQMQNDWAEHKGLRYLRDAWDRRIKTAELKISTLQTMSNNARNEYSTKLEPKF